MSNILVLKNYTITDHTKWYGDRSNEANLANNYNQMEEVCVQSAHNRIKDLDSVKVFRGEASNIRDVFKENFFEIYELWKEGHNILYCDLDVVFTKEVEYFGKYNKFTMFNFTDPANTSDSFYNVTFENYFNCGIRYYPKEMSQEAWDIGIAMVENWNPDRWDAEQIIYNAMMWGQDKELNSFYNPTKAYQMLHDPNTPHGSTINSHFNRIELRDACAVHVHGSRGSANRLEIMKALKDGSLTQDTEEYLYL